VVDPKLNKWVHATYNEIHQVHKQFSGEQGTLRSALTHWWTRTVGHWVIITERTKGANLYVAHGSNHIRAIDINGQVVAINNDFSEILRRAGSDSDTFPAVTFRAGQIVCAFVGGQWVYAIYKQICTTGRKIDGELWTRMTGHEVTITNLNNQAETQAFTVGVDGVRATIPT